jgi:hypothetical protein
MTRQPSRPGALASGRFSRLLTALLVLGLVLPTEKIGRAAGELIALVAPTAPVQLASSGGTVGLRLALVNGSAQAPAKVADWLVSAR